VGFHGLGFSFKGREILEAYLGLTKVLPVFFVVVGGGALTVGRFTAACAGTANATMRMPLASTDGERKKLNITPIYKADLDSQPNY
jgi:hypothetical protein